MVDINNYIKNNIPTEDAETGDNYTYFIPGSSLTPVVNFTLSTTEEKTNNDITFDASGSYSPDSSIETYKWNQGVNSNSYVNFEGNEIENLDYDDDGTYQAQLKVIDENGNEATTSKTITINNRPPKVEKLELATTNQLNTGQLDGPRGFLITASDDGDISTYKLDMYNNGTFDVTGSNRSLSYDFSQDNLKTGDLVEVRAYVEDDDGETDTLIKQYYVDGVQPVSVAEDFEDSLSSYWDISPDYTQRSTSYANTGSYSLEYDHKYSAAEELASWSVPELDGSSGIYKFEFYNLEKQKSFGSALMLEDGNGDRIFGGGTNNPEIHYILDNTNSTSISKDHGNYEDWFRYTFTVDYPNGTFDIEVENTDTGDIYSETGVSFDNSTYPTKVVYYSWSGNFGADNCVNYIDDISISIEP